jgi:hypothetical protein
MKWGGEMRITDYEKSRSLRDVLISLTNEEAEELSLYLSALIRRPQVKGVHLSEVSNGRLERDIRIEIAPIAV